MIPGYPTFDAAVAGLRELTTGDGSAAIFRDERDTFRARLLAYTGVLSYGQDDQGQLVTYKPTHAYDFGDLGERLLSFVDDRVLAFVDGDLVARNPAAPQ